MTTPSGTPARLQQIDHREGRQRGLGRRLEDDRAAGRERGPDLAGGHRRRKVPRCDEHRDADRLVGHQDPLVPARGGAVVPHHPDCLLGEPAEELGGVADLRPGVGEDLPVLAGDQLGELLGLHGEQLEGTAQDLGALPRRPGRPAGQRGVRRGYRGVAVRFRRRGHLGDHLAGGRVVHGHPAGAWLPGAVDEQVGEQLHQKSPRRITGERRRGLRPAAGSTGRGPVPR